MIRHFLLRRIFFGSPHINKKSPEKTGPLTISVSVFAFSVSPQLCGGRHRCGAQVLSCCQYPCIA